jgi:hypothetical protein
MGRPLHRRCSIVVSTALANISACWCVLEPNKLARLTQIQLSIWMDARV